MTGSKVVTQPPRLAAGARVAILAPSGPCLEQDDVTRSIELCRALGLDAVCGAHVRDRLGYLAGSDADRLDDLNTALRDPAIDAIWCIRGGFGMTRILDEVDFEALRQRPRAIIGFSDITALLLAVHGETGVVTFHGPTARHALPEFSLRHFDEVLRNAEPAGRLERLPQPAGVLAPRANRIVTLRPGIAEGPLLGGNLSLLQCLIGTRYFPDFTGAILFLEDVGEALYRVDRMLAHLRSVGAFRQLAGVLVGRFTEMRRETSDGAFGFDEVLEQYFGPLGVPVAYGFPVGHIDDQWTLPIGVRARLDATHGEVDLLDAAVS